MYDIHSCMELFPMAKCIKSSKSKHSESFYVINDDYNPSTYETVAKFLDAPAYSLSDVYRSLNERYTCDEVFSMLRDLNITYLNGTNHIPSFTRTEIDDALAETFGFQPSREIITQKYPKKFQRVVNSKKSTKLK